MSNTLQVLADRPGPVPGGEHGSSRRLEMDGQASDRLDPRPPEYDPGQQPMDRFGMKRGEGIGRVGLETEQLAALAGPGRAAGVGLVRAQSPGYHATIAEAMEDRAIAIELDAAKNVRVMSDDDIGAGVHGGMGKRALVRRQLRGHMHDALVQSYDADVSSRLPGLLYVSSHGGNRLRIRSLQCRTGSDVFTLTRHDSDIRATGVGLRGPTLLRADAVVAQKRDSSAPCIQPRWRTGRSESHSGSGMCDSQPVELFDRVRNTFGATVGDVVTCKRDRLESGSAQGAEVLGRRARRGHVSRHLPHAKRMRDFEMSNGKGRGAQGRGNAAQPIVRIGLIENQIAATNQVEVGHCPAPGRSNQAGSSGVLRTVMRAPSVLGSRPLSR